MAGMGPPPNPNARRRNARPAKQLLPAEGRPGKAPRWPLVDDVVMRSRLELYEGRLAAAQDKLDDAEAEGRPTYNLVAAVERYEERCAELRARLKEQRRLEAQLWRDLWRTPQAVGWERLGYLREVAQYVRFKVLAELGDLEAAKESRQLADRLGLTPLALLRLQWEIAEPVKSDEGAVPAGVTQLDEYRSMYG